MAQIIIITSKCNQKNKADVHINQNYYQILCFSMSIYLNAYKQFLFILTVDLTHCQYF